MPTSRVLVLMFALASVVAVPAKGQTLGRPVDTVVVQSGSLELRALLWRPPGRGPFRHTRTWESDVFAFLDERTRR